jgi:hypothetical protein
MRFKDITQTYELIKDVGYELLKMDRIKKETYKKPEEKWTESDYESRALGYGNGSKLFLGQQNVPTSTITALWLPTPDNENKIIVQGKEVFWKPLFYRKTKKLGEVLKKVMEEIFPKILVKKIECDGIITDSYTYDFLTLIGLHRSDLIFIYGHEPNFIIELNKNLNKVEDEFYKKSKQQDEFPRREWFSFTINQRGLAGVQEEIDKAISEITEQNIGIVLIVDISIINKNISLLKNLISNLSEGNSSKTISIIIDCSTRNIEILKVIQRSLQEYKISSIYVSNQIALEEMIFEINSSVFEDTKEFQNIVYYLQDVVGKKVDVRRLGEKDLKSFQRIKLELMNSVPSKLTGFSPKEFIAEFENILIKPESNKGNWQIFFTELLSVCNTYTPEFIEYIIYYSAKSSDEFIRFNALRFAKDREYLIDYWLEGNSCDIKYFTNISQFIEAPILFIMYPILRFYNRHKAVEGLKKRLLKIITEILDGKYFDDYWLAEKVLGENSDKYTTELLSMNSMTVMKLVECGVDIFDEIDSVILRSNLVSDLMIDKIILSTRMTSKKIDMIFEKFQHLLIY